jgi:hypothetical protein
MKRKSLAIALIVVGICTLSVVSASAQSFFTVNYFANNGVSGAPDATVRITNPGTAVGGVLPEAPVLTIGGSSSTTAPAGSNGNLCAMIYVFDNDQQMDECCGCLTTPDGLRTLSVTKDLTSNPLVGTVVNHGDIKLVASVLTGSPCDPTILEIYNGVDELRAWATHTQNKVGTAYPITETAFSDVQYSIGELFSLTNDCYFVERLGSGHGICSCGTGD